MIKKQKVLIADFPWLAFAVFLVCRGLILFSYQQYLSDVEFYFSVAQNGLGKGLTAYKDFHWSYPPLSLVFVYLPYFIAKTFTGYRFGFQLLCFLLECGVFFLLQRFLTVQLKFSSRKTTQALLLYSVLGLFMGHLLYDRIDILVLLSLMGLLTMTKQNSLLATLPGVFGTLCKITPVFWLPPVLFIRWFRERGTSFWSMLALSLGPIALTMIIYNQLINGTLIETLSMHSDRGIQVESVWATPLMLIKAFVPDAGVQIENNNGAQHLGGSLVTQTYLNLSKVFGFLLLGLGYLHLLWTLWRARSEKRTERELNWLLFMAQSAVTVLFLATQRVLSIQFFIWLVPVLAVLLPQAQSGFLWCVSPAIFALAYIGFDIGYWQFVAFQPAFVLVVALRNILLVLVSSNIIIRYWRVLNEFARSATAPLESEITKTRTSRATKAGSPKAVRVKRSSDGVRRDK